MRLPTPRLLATRPAVSPVRTLTAIVVLVCGLAGYGLAGIPAANAQNLAAVPAPTAVLEPGGTATLALRVLALGPGGALPGEGAQLIGPAPATVRAALYYGLDWGYADSDPQQVLAAVWYAQTGAWPDSGDHAIATRILSAAQANPNPSWLSQGTSLLTARQNSRVQVAPGALTATGLNGHMGTGTLQITSLSGTRQSLYLPYGVLLSDGTNQALAWAVSAETGPAPAATGAPTEPPAATATEPPAATATATPTANGSSPTRTPKPPPPTPAVNPVAESPTAAPPTRTPKPPPYTPTASVTMAPPTAEPPVAIAKPPTVAVAKPPTLAPTVQPTDPPASGGGANRPADTAPQVPTARRASGPPTIPPANVAAADRNAAGILPPPQATGGPNPIATSNPPPIATARATPIRPGTPSATPSPRPTVAAAPTQAPATVTIAAVRATVPPLPTIPPLPGETAPLPTPSATGGAPGIEPPVKPTETPVGEPTATTEEQPTPIVLNPGAEPPPAPGGETGGVTGQPPQQQPTTGRGSSPVFPALFLLGTLALTVGTVLRRVTRAGARG